MTIQPPFGERMTYQDTRGFAFIAKNLIFFDEHHLPLKGRWQKEASAILPVTATDDQPSSLLVKEFPKIAIKREGRVFIRSWRYGFDNLR